MKVQGKSKAKKKKEKKEYTLSGFGWGMPGPIAVHAFLWSSIAAPAGGRRICAGRGPKRRMMQCIPPLRLSKEVRYLYKEGKRVILADFWRNGEKMGNFYKFEQIMRDAA